MTKPIGGRGHKAPYKTTTVRIPIDLKPQVDELVDRFREGSLKINNTSKVETIIPDLKAIIERYKLNSKSSRDWVQFNKLISELEKELTQEAELLA
jgi:hypothetical protein